MSKKYAYQLNLTYIAPDNAVDEQGKPVKVYYRSLALNKERFDETNRQMKQGKKNIVLESVYDMGDGTKITGVEYIHLDNPQLMLAHTLAYKVLTEEEAAKLQKKGTTVLYDSEGRPITPRGTVN